MTTRSDDEIARLALVEAAAVHARIASAFRAESRRFPRRDAWVRAHERIVDLLTAEAERMRAQPAAAPTAAERGAAFGTLVEVDGGLELRASDHFEVYSIGLCHASVCSNMAVESVAARLNAEHPTGVGPWCLSTDKLFSDGETPVGSECTSKHTPGARHWLFAC